MLKFFKVTALPGVLEADAFYYVLNGSYAETYLTNSAGEAKACGNTAMIDALINARMAAASTLQQVATIAARDTAKATATGNTMYLVTNATGDATVAGGAALYFYNKGSDTFTKISEYESMDVVLQWANIQGKPNSTPAAIDTAVGQAHTHANAAVLNNLSDSGGKLAYGGAVVGGGDWTTTNW